MQHVTAPAAQAQEANYPFNHWWVAASSDEIRADRITSRRLLGRHVAMYRLGDGTVVALHDRCPHRGTPLSRGTLKEDVLTCAYHGFQFAPDGRCVRIPTQDNIPQSARVGTYPLVEKPPYLWIWMGEQALADADDVPELPFMTDPSWVVAHGLIDLDINYMSLKENVLDLTHLGYVHAASFGMLDYVAPPDLKIQGDAVGFTQTFMHAPLPAFYGGPSGIGTERLVDRIDTGMSMSPALHLSTVEIINTEPLPGERERYWLRFCHITTPAGPRGTHYWWVLARDHGHFDGAVAALTAVVEAAFAEDKDILETIEMRNDEGMPAVELSVAADRPALECRKQLRRLLERERGAALSTAE